VLRSLTPRGWALAATGTAIGAGALLLGERDLLRFAVLVLSLPLVGAVLLVLCAPRDLTQTRTLSAVRVPVGGDCRVTLTLARADTALPLPLGPVVAEDRLPFALGSPPRFPLGLLRPGERRRFSYRLRSHARGRYPVGPLVLSVTDPLGCARLERRVGAEASLLVVPRTVELPAVAPRGGGTGAGGQRRGPRPADTAEDAVPRPYRPGDDVRRVHWRSTARRGRLMVRGEEQRRLDHGAVLVDLRSAAHTAAAAASSLEDAVVLAASVAVHLVGLGHRLRLLGAGEGPVDARHRDTVLDALAVARPVTGESSLVEDITRLSRSPVLGRGMLVAVLGALSPEEVAALAACRAGRSGTRVAVLVPRAAWSAQERDRAAWALAEAGWRVLCPDRVADLPGLWRDSGEAR